jgi:hypothetical protein
MGHDDRGVVAAALLGIAFQTAQTLLVAREPAGDACEARANTCLLSLDVIGRPSRSFEAHSLTGGVFPLSDEKVGEPSAGRIVQTG